MKCLFDPPAIRAGYRLTAPRQPTLTRDEYANTVRDLLGVPFDAADPNGLPEDPEWHGFERIGSVIKEGRRPWQIKLTDEAGEPLWPILIVDAAA
jgi:hypothetical protein